MNFQRAAALAAATEGCPAVMLVRDKRLSAAQKRLVIVLSLSCCKSITHQNQPLP